MKPSMCREEAWAESTVEVTSVREVQSRAHIKVMSEVQYGIRNKQNES